MREICLDTETTGLNPKTGDKIVEIACIELINRVKTNNHYHVYINIFYLNATIHSEFLPMPD